METTQATVIGRGSHGVVREVPGEPHVVVKQIDVIKTFKDGDEYFSVDAVLEPAAIRRLNCCGCPYIVEMHRCEVDVEQRRVNLYLERLLPISGPSEAIRIVSQLVAGIASMHACGVYHRDIKTVNVMMSPGETGNVRIIDFSLALLDAARLTTECDDMYTLNYRAPEVLLGYSHYDREKAESWALGVTCAEILLGMRASNLFIGMKWNHILSSIIDANPEVDYGSIYYYYPGWDSFIKNDLYREGTWRYREDPLRRVIGALCGEKAADFICHACDPRPAERWTATKLLEHDFIREYSCCRIASESIDLIRNGQKPARLRMPRMLPITKPPSARYHVYLEGLGCIESVEGQSRRALAEALLRFLGIDDSGRDRESYEGALVITGALCKYQAHFFRPRTVMNVLAANGIFEFFSRHVYVLINDE